MNDFYVWLKSTDSQNYYPKNVSDHFRVRLAARLNFKNANWVVALKEIHIPELAEPRPLDHQFYSVFTSICGQSIVGDRSLSLLRKVKAEKETYLSEFIHGYYIPVLKAELEDIDIHILNESGDYFTFLPGTHTHCLFHFKKLKR